MDSKSKIKIKHNIELCPLCKDHEVIQELVRLKYTEVTELRHTDISRSPSRAFLKKILQYRRHASICDVSLTTS